MGIHCINVVQMFCVCWVQLFAFVILIARDMTNSQRVEMTFAIFIYGNFKHGRDRKGYTAAHNQYMFTLKGSSYCFLAV